MEVSIRRKILKYETLKCELEEAEILSKEYFERFINEVFPDQYNNLYLDNNSNNCNNQESSEDEEEPQRTENLKKIYKKLSLKLHPDRNRDLEGEEKEEQEELFKEIVDSYESGDLCNLLVRAREFRVKIPELKDEEMKIVDKNIREIEEKINRIKKQTSWVWCTTTNPRVKERIKEVLKKTIQEAILFDWIIEEKTDCPICLEKMDPANTEKRIICGHIFHKFCIMSWFNIKFSCPLCRTSFE